MAQKSKKLKVPYIKQSYSASCGAAALAMVYKFYGLGRLEKEIWRKKKKPRPFANEDFIWTSDLVEDAQEIGFNAYWKRTDPTNKDSCFNLLNELINKNVPVIVCQQWAEEQPKKGHFRVVVHVSKKFVEFHDPDLKFGKANVKWDWNKFLKFWQPTGEEVTGGVYIVIEKPRTEQNQHRVLTK